MLIPYYRQSRKRERTISIDEQRRAVTRWARAADVQLGEEIVEQGVSGSKGWRDRELGRAIEVCERKEAQGIVVAWQDRLSRESSLGTAEVWEALDRAGARLVCAAEGLDTATGDHELLFAIKAALNRENWKRYRANWQDARRNAVERGVHVARARLGYRRDSQGALVVDGRRRRLVVDLFELRAGGGSWHELCLLLDRRAPRPDGGAWPRQTVQGMIRSRTYLGEGEAGSRHEALVSRELWEAANQRQGKVPRFSPAPRLLTGLVRCAGCSGTMSGSLSRGGRRREPYRFYRCRGRRASGICPAPATIGCAPLDEYVWALFLERVRDAEIAAESPGAVDDSAALLDALTLAESELALYRDESLISEIGVDAYRAGLAVRQRVVDERRAEYDTRAPSLGVLRVALLEIADTADTAERRLLIASIVEHVTVERHSGCPLGERVAVRWRGDPDTLRVAPT